MKIIVIIIVIDIDIGKKIPGVIIDTMEDRHMRVILAAGFPQEAEETWIRSDIIFPPTPWFFRTDIIGWERII